MMDAALSLIMVLGGVFSFMAALGAVRLPDLFTRMHATTKAGTLGTGLVFAAAALYFRDIGVTLKALAAICFLLLTAPVAAHLVGRTAYRTGITLWHKTRVDELRGEDTSDSQFP